MKTDRLVSKKIILLTLLSFCISFTAGYAVQNRYEKAEPPVIITIPSGQTSPYEIPETGKRCEVPIQLQKMLKDAGFSTRTPDKATWDAFLERVEKIALKDFESGFSGNTLNMALKSGMVINLDYILRNHPEMLNEPDKDGLTPLFNSLKYQTYAFNLLLNTEADIFHTITEDGQEKDLINFMLRYGISSKTIKQLENSGLEIEDPSEYIVDAAEGQNTEYFNRLLKDTDLNRRTQSGSTIFTQAIIKGADLEMLNNMLEKNPKINDSKGITPLFLTSAGNKNINYEYAGKLRRLGADINARDSRTGETALIASVKNGNLELTKYLTKHGADVKTKDASGKSAEDYAAENPALKKILKGGN
jgi:ankyrin repeat protein